VSPRPISGGGLRLCLATVAVLPGCGYVWGFHPVASRIRTVAVEVVDNLSFRQRLERDLTRSIARQLSEYSPYRHATKTTADAILRVEIVAVRNGTLVIGRTKPVEEGSLDTIARIRLVERRTGAILVDTRRRDVAEYRTLISETETSARHEMVSDLGRAIVLALEGDL
jgi:Lipopolysaccharide-assembly